ncbi:SEFIR domain-containing protein [Amycolatopsis sp. NPDC049159]|uniref:SEFIR domain-containing protein n=1 Tax=Amycolatopsis sp. NPDC049159 TaxID=3157210 RepID=UPI0033C94EFC
MTSREHPKAFVSYIHDSPQHCDAVREFSTFLRSEQGIDVILDQWASDQRQDWQAWATKNILESDFVIVVASEGYQRVGDGYGPNDRNLGGQAEAATLRNLLQGDRQDWTRKLLPVILPGHSVHEIPQFLSAHTNDHYPVTSFTPEGADSLLRHITRQPRHPLPPLGPLPVLPPLSGAGAAVATPAPERNRTALLEEFPVVWRADLLRRGRQSQSPLVEVHLVPAERVARFGVLQLERVSEGLVALGRSRRLFTQTQSVSAISSDESARAVSEDWRSGESGLAVLRGGQRTCWFGLPAANIGWILDREHLAAQIADRLHTLLEIDLPLPGRFAPAIALEPVSLTRIAKIAEISATSAPLPMNVPEHIRVEAEEAFPTSDLRHSIRGVAEELVARLAATFRR